jgi:hypothetical protein
MQQLRKLLSMNDSNIAKFLQSSLRGLEVSLKDSQEKFPDDPGANICDAVLQEIQGLLQPSSNSINQNQTPVATRKEDSDLENTQNSKSSELQLRSLRDAFYAEKNHLNQYLGDFQLHSQTDADLWKEIQLKLLRLPREISNTWKERALRAAQEAQAEEEISNNIQLRFNKNEEIYPGIKGSIQANGLSLSLSENAILNSQVLQEIEYKDLPDDLKLLACLVSFCIKLIDIEPDLYHALETVNKFDIIHLNSNIEQRNKYIESLKERFQRTVKAVHRKEDLLTVLKAWINIDEAINSLVFVPPASSDSWWGELKKHSRRILIGKIAKKAKEEGHDVQIKELSGAYANIHKFSVKDYDVPLKVGGIPGEVQACLRVYARINQDNFPGRVIYRSLQSE